MVNMDFNFVSNGKYNVSIKDGYLSWSRKGLRNFMIQGSKGEKSIPIKSITAIQLKEPGLTTGYIQFAYSGSSESKGGTMSAVNDENTILFLKKELKQAKELKSMVESIQRQNSTSSPQISGADEIIKFKQLLDEGILTVEEFETKKKQILGI